MLRTAIAIILVACTAGPCGAMGRPDNLWQGLIAEATGDGYEGMYAVACVVRNRLAKGMDTGLVGLQRANLGQFCKAEGHSREVMAKEIVRRVFEQRGPDVTKGALYFEGIDYPTPYWAVGKKVVAQIGRHVFYK